jgi:hypothetical protein
MVEPCKNCHKLPLKAGGCTVTCAIQTIGGLATSMVVTDIVLNTSMSGKK